MLTPFKNLLYTVQIFRSKFYLQDTRIASRRRQTRMNKKNGRYPIEISRYLQDILQHSTIEAITNSNSQGIISTAGFSRQWKTHRHCGSTLLRFQYSIAVYLLSTSCAVSFSFLSISLGIFWPSPSNVLSVHLVSSSCNLASILSLIWHNFTLIFQQFVQRKVHGFQCYTK